MIPRKTKAEAEIMIEGGKRLAWVMKKVLETARPGARFIELDQLAEKLIKKQKGQPSFKMVPKYRWTTCLNVNEGVVHGVPNNYQLKSGDVISVDIGMYYQGFHTDMARTVMVQGQETNKKQKEQFIKFGKETLKEAINMTRPNNRIGHLSWAIEQGVKKAGYSPIETLTGHGIGKNLHEPPQIPCFLREKIEKTETIKPGMTLAIEVIYAQGSPELKLADDGWTLATEDGSLTGLFEDTILVTKNKPLIITN